MEQETMTSGEKPEWQKDLRRLRKAAEERNHVQIGILIASWIAAGATILIAIKYYFFEFGL